MLHNKILSSFVDCDKINYNKINKKILCYKNINTIYNFIEKNGCTTLKTTFSKADGTIEDGDIHLNDRNYYLSTYSNDFDLTKCTSQNEKQLLYQRFVQTIKDDKLKTILVLRDPYKRIVSAYLDKITKTHKHFVFKLNQQIFSNQRRVDLIAAEQLIQEGKHPSFFEFISYIASQPDSIIENHFCQQSSMIYLKEFSEIFNLDDLEKDWGSSIFKNIPLLGHNHESNHFTSRLKVVSEVEDEYYTRDLIYLEGQELLNITKSSNIFPSYKLFFIEKRVRDLFNERFHLDIELFNSLFHIDSKLYIDIFTHTTQSTILPASSKNEIKLESADALCKSNYDSLRSIQHDANSIKLALADNVKNLKELRGLEKQIEAQSLIIEKSKSQLETVYDRVQENTQVTSNQISLLSDLISSFQIESCRAFEQQIIVLQEAKLQLHTLETKLNTLETKLNTLETKLNTQETRLKTQAIRSAAQRLKLQNNSFENHLHLETKLNAVLFQLAMSQVKKSLLTKLINSIFQPFIKKKAFSRCNGGRISAAERIAIKIIRNNPSMSWAYYILAKCQYAQGIYTLALENVQIAIDLDPQIEFYSKYKKRILLKIKDNAKT